VRPYVPFTQIHPFQTVAPNGVTVFFSNIRLAVDHVVECADLGWLDATITDLRKQHTYCWREIQAMYMKGGRK